MTLPVSLMGPFKASEPSSFRRDGLIFPKIAGRFQILADVAKRNGIDPIRVVGQTFLVGFLRQVNASALTQSEALTCDVSLATVLLTVPLTSSGHECENFAD